MYLLKCTHDEVRLTMQQRFLLLECAIVGVASLKYQEKAKMHGTAVRLIFSTVNSGRRRALYLMHLNLGLRNGICSCIRNDLACFALSFYFPPKFTNDDEVKIIFPAALGSCFQSA